MSDHAAKSSSSKANLPLQTASHTADLGAEQDLEMLQRALEQSNRTVTNHSILYLQRAIGNRAVQGLLSKTGQRPQIQRMTLNGAPVVIDQINDAAELSTHIKRYFRLKQNKPEKGDEVYTYEESDLAAIKAQQKNVQGAAAAKKFSDLVAALEGAVGNLGTASAIANPQSWNGTSPTGEEGAEDFNSPSVAADSATVIAEWQNFLGAGPYSHVHPRTGGNEPTRLISADGQRSIRYGNHEKTSKPNLHHYHEETWVHNATTNTVKVLNLVRRVPVT